MSIHYEPLPNSIEKINEMLDEEERFKKWLTERLKDNNFWESK